MRFAWSSDKNPVTEMVITTQLGQKKTKKKKVLKSEAELLLLQPSLPSFAPDSHQAPGTEPQPERAFPLAPSSHMPALYDTICFLLQLFSSVVRHSSEMRPSTFIPGQAPPPAPWVVRGCSPLHPGGRSCSAW